ADDRKRLEDIHLRELSIFVQGVEHIHFAADGGLAGAATEGLAGERPGARVRIVASPGDERERRLGLGVSTDEKEREQPQEERRQVALCGHWDLLVPGSGGCIAKD